MSKRLSRIVFMLGVTSILCAGGLALAAQPSVAAGGCQKCSKDRQWCHCTYNGLPRVSCNPCCYGNLGIPQVCLD